MIIMVALIVSFVVIIVLLLLALIMAVHGCLRCLAKIEYATTESLLCLTALRVLLANNRLEDRTSESGNLFLDKLLNNK